MLLAEPSCAAASGSLCQKIWQLWSVDWLAVAADTVLAPGLRILLIVVICLVLRGLLHRMVSRVVRITAAGVPVPRRFLSWRDRIDESVIGPTMITRRRERSAAIGSLLRSVTSFVIVVIGFILVLSELGLNVAPLLASAGIAGVAIGFGAQNLVRDFLSGIAIILEDQCGVGDWVDLGSATGTVVDMGLRTTTLRGGDGIIWHVRNGEILRVGNISQGDVITDVDFAVPFRLDLRKAADLALQAATEVASTPEFAERVLVMPALQGVPVMTHETATLRITSTVAVGTQAPFGREVRMAVKTAWDAAGLVE